jgi:abhydrolase domain-containing protein 11
MYLSLLRRNKIVAHHITTPKVQITNPPLYMLHGVLGNKGNFRTPAKKIAEVCGCEIVSLDARNHGESFHAPIMSYRSMAEDVKVLAKHLNHENVNILGHSMGGRTVMTAALESVIPSNSFKINKLIVSDVSPDNTRSSKIGDTVSSYIKQMAKVDMQKINGEKPKIARKYVQDELASIVKDAGVMAFLMMNLTRDKTSGNYLWKANIHALCSQIEQIAKFPVYEHSFDNSTLFLKGETSDYIKEEHYGEIHRLFPSVEIKVIEKAGHWLHADQPVLFVDAVAEFLNRK